MILISKSVIYKINIYNFSFSYILYANIILYPNEATRSTPITIIYLPIIFRNSYNHSNIDGNNCYTTPLLL